MSRDYSTPHVPRGFWCVIPSTYIVKRLITHSFLNIIAVSSLEGVKLKLLRRENKNA